MEIDPLHNIQQSTLPVKGLKLYLALITIEQSGFLSMPHLLCHRASVYNGHLQGHMILKSVAEHLAVELSLPVFITYSIDRTQPNTKADPESGPKVRFGSASSPLFKNVRPLWVR